MATDKLYLQDQGGDAGTDTPTTPAEGETSTEENAPTEEKKEGDSN